MARKKKSSHTGSKLLAAGITTLGIYMLYGAKHAKQNRKKAKSWMLKAKGEVLEKAEKLKQMDRSDYERIVAQVEGKYKKLKSVDNKELAALAKELKGHWKDIEKEFMAKKKPKRKPAKKKATTKKRSVRR
tara:strand:- start:1343 stop:1735 length:393 start_codon:yes stop_codon:yes gene_type:complete